MAMFIRVKRKKTTYFLHCDPTETILEIKQKVQALSDNPVDCQRLILLNTQQILDDNKTLADQKRVQGSGLVDPEALAKDETVQGLQGLLLEDAKSLAEQQVENDAIVALCLKISDPRVHRIPTLMRNPHITPAVSPTPPTEAVVEEMTLAPGEKVPPPPSPPPERRMSTELRAPYRQPMEAKYAEKDDKDGSQVGSTFKKDGSLKEATTTKKETPQKEGGKKEFMKKEPPKKDTSKKEAPKKETSKKGGDKNGGRETPRKSGKETSKKGGKKTSKEETPPESEKVTEAPADAGVWEDITIDKLTYASLVDSD